LDILTKIDNKFNKKLHIINKMITGPPRPIPFIPRSANEGTPTSRIFSDTFTSCSKTLKRRGGGCGSCSGSRAVGVSDVDLRFEDFLGGDFVTGGADSVVRSDSVDFFLGFEGFEGFVGLRLGSLHTSIKSNQQICKRLPFVSGFLESVLFVSL
jgi:hypothetical protein